MYKRNGRVIGREDAGLVADYLEVKRRSSPNRRQRQLMGRFRPKSIPGTPRRQVMPTSPFCPKCSQFLFPEEVRQGCAHCGTTN